MEISICITCYNEESTIAELIYRFSALFDYLNIEYEFNVFDNGSTDYTLSMLANMYKNTDYNFGSLIHSDVTLSYLEGYKKAISMAHGDYVFVVDADMQYEPQDFVSLWLYRKHFDIVTGVKIHREDPLFRKIQSRVMSILVGIFFRKFYYDSNCGFRLFKRSCKKYVANTKYLLRSPGTEFLLRADKDKKDIIEIPVNHYPRRFGKSTVSGFKDMLTVVREQIKGLVLLWKEM